MAEEANAPLEATAMGNTKNEDELKALQEKVRALEVQCIEKDKLLQKTQKLEKEVEKLRQSNSQNNPGNNSVEKLKKINEEVLTKAKGLLFEKEKTNQNQQRQIEAYVTQVVSLKDVVSITKDLLEIRNIECTHLQSRLETMDLKIKTEREKQNLVMNRFNAAIELNLALKEEYGTQLKIFKELKLKYELKLSNLSKENQELRSELEKYKRSEVPSGSKDVVLTPPTDEPQNQ